MDYEALEAINASLKTIKIKGKDYVMVNQRVMAFRELLPNGTIKTDIVFDDGERCTVKATILDGNTVLATGHAYEIREGMINKTSYIENCETSAIGRALGILGIGATESIASADEVKSAINQQRNGSEIIGECTACGQRFLFENEQQLTYSMCTCGNPTFRRVS